jgi:hypothetical protein
MRFAPVAECPRRVGAGTQDERTVERTTGATMPLPIAATGPTLLIRRDAFERVGLTRSALDERLNLTADEFRMEGALIVVGPIPSGEALGDLIAELEGMGLEYFEEFFELSGNWPDWLRLYAMAAGGEPAPRP